MTAPVFGVLPLPAGAEKIIARRGRSNVTATLAPDATCTVEITNRNSAMSGADAALLTVVAADGTTATAILRATAQILVGPF